MTPQIFINIVQIMAWYWTGAKSSPEPILTYCISNPQQQRSEILNVIQAFSFMKMHLKMSLAICQPFHSSLNFIIYACLSMHASPTCIFCGIYACNFVFLCCVLVMIIAIADSKYLFTHILQGSFTGTGAIIWLPQCQWGNPEGYGV